MFLSNFKFRMRGRRQEGGTWQRREKIFLEKENEKKIIIRILKL